MIYDPEPTFVNLKAAAAVGLTAAFIRAGVDYIQGTGQPWAYYLGYGLGAGTMATGIPGAEIALITAASGANAVVEVIFETSPGAAEVEVFLDGVSQSVIDTNLVLGTIVATLNIPNDGLDHVVSMVSLGTAVGVPAATNWMAIQRIQTTNAILQNVGVTPMATVICGFTIRDVNASGTARNRNTQTCSVTFPLGSLTLTQIQAYHDALAAAIDDVTEGIIISSRTSIKFALPAGLKSVAVAGSDVQEGGLLQFTLNGSTLKDSLRVPAFINGAQVNKTIDLTDPNVTALRDLLNGTTQTAGQSIAASDANGNTYDALVAGSLSFRK